MWHGRLAHAFADHGRVARATKCRNLPSNWPCSSGGKGMYGRRVHEAVLAQGCKVSGCTVHFVDNDYDAGPIILQKCCVVAEDDSPESLALRVAELERAAYPQAIELFRQGRL